MQDATELDGTVAHTPLFPSNKKDSSSFPNDTLYSLPLNGSQTNAARGSGLGEGGVRNETASTFDSVLSCTPIKTVAVPTIKLPRSGNDIFVEEMTQPNEVSVFIDFATERPSWSRWTNATIKFNRQIMRNCATIEPCNDQKAVAGSLF
jgi:hypothetical protein